MSRLTCTRHWRLIYGIKAGSAPLDGMDVLNQLSIGRLYIGIFEALLLIEAWLM